MGNLCLNSDPLGISGRHHWCQSVWWAKRVCWISFLVTQYIVWRIPKTVLFIVLGWTYTLVTLIDYRSGRNWHFPDSQATGKETRIRLDGRFSVIQAENCFFFRSNRNRKVSRGNQFESLLEICTSNNGSEKNERIGRRVKKFTPTELWVMGKGFQTVGSNPVSVW